MIASSRIKDPALAAGIEDNELAWLRFVTPITEHRCHQISRREYQGMEEEIARRWVDTQEEVPATDRELQVAHSARPLR